MGCRAALSTSRVGSGVLAMLTSRVGGSALDVCAEIETKAANAATENDVFRNLVIASPLFEWPKKPAN
jgi:uncharacterized membrane protein YcjF (UPF0283 family)